VRTSSYPSDSTRARKSAMATLLVEPRLTARSSATQRFKASKGDHQAAADAAGLEATVGLAGLLWREGGGHAQGDLAGLHLLAKAIELGLFRQVLADPHRVHGDAPLGFPLEAAHGGERAPVLHRR